jgi:AcrR family transcriptional regulator
LTDRRQRILDAAMAVFAEKGFAAASTSEIARRADVAEGTIFRHYRTKKDLLVALVRPLVEQVVLPMAEKKIQTVMDKDHPTLEAFVADMYDERTQFVRESPELLKVVIQELLLHDEIRQVAQEIFSTRFAGFFEAKLVRMQAQGLIRPMPTWTAFRLMASVIGVYALARYIVLPNATWDDERERAESIRFICRGLAP